jgi:hypothetical protein
MAQVYAHVNMFASPAGDLDLVSFEEALKEHYHGQQVTDLVYKNRPLLALLPKYTKMGGRVMPVPVMSANPQNRSATFTAAQKTGAVLGPNQYQPSQIQSFLLTRDRDYSIARVDGETLDASKGDSNAFMQAATAEIDGAMSAISRSLCHALYRNGSGVMFDLTAGAIVPGPGTFQLNSSAANAEQITGVEVGMLLQDNVAVPTMQLLITAVQRGGATPGFTCTQVGGAGVPVLGPPATQFCVVGDRNLKVSGLEAWIPAVAPIVGDNFFGVDRSVDSTRLAGIRGVFNATIEQTLIATASLIGREGGRPDYCFMSFDDFSLLVQEIGVTANRIRYTKSDGEGPADKGTIGFQGLEINAPYGSITVIPDADCPPQTAFLLQLDTWSLNSLGQCPRILSHDGNRLLRVTDADAIEARIGYYAQLSCKAPGWNGRCPLA